VIETTGAVESTAASFISSPPSHFSGKFELSSDHLGSLGLVPFGYLLGAALLPRIAQRPG
jgi:hypothetical protein